MTQSAQVQPVPGASFSGLTRAELEAGFVTLTTTQGISGDKTFSGLLNASGRLVLAATNYTATTPEEVMKPAGAVARTGYFLEAPEGGTIFTGMKLPLSPPLVGQFVYLFNETPEPITLRNESGAVESKLRFLLPAAKDVILKLNESIMFVQRPTVAGGWARIAS